jgi:hypothetical protein
METHEAVVESYPNRPLAEIAAGLLESAEIPHRIISDDAGGAYPMLDLTHGVRLVVARADLQRARNILGVV